MTRFTCLILLMLFTTSAYAQDKRNTIDSLNNKLKTARDKDKAVLYNMLAGEYSYISGDTTLMYAQKAIEYAVKYKEKFTEGAALALTGIIYKNRGDYETSLKYQLKGLKIAELLNDERGLASSYNSIGIIYKKMRRWDEALAYYLKANNSAKRSKDLIRVSLTYNNIATIYLEKKEWKKVELYYDSAWMYAELSGDTHAKSTVLGNLGDLYREQKKFKKSIDVTTLCLVYDKANEDKYGMFVSYFQLARAYSELRDYPKWELYADSAENVATAEHLNRELIDLISWRSSVASWQGKVQESYDYYKQARNINDSLLNIETSKQISELQTQYETEKKEQQIALQQSELGRKNMVIIGISIFMILAALLGYSYYRRYMLKQQARLQQAVMHEQELATQAVIEAEEKERKRIAGDLHDGVGQLMSAARMNLSVVANELKFDNDNQRLSFDKALSLVDDSCKEVRAVSHNIMPNALLKTGLASAIRDFVQKIDHRALEVNLYVDGLNERLSSNTETVLYRVIQECVNNVIKHAGANKLDITLIKDEEGISITIEDNGKGFNTTAVQDDEGIGLKNMQTRIHYLKGTIEWDTAPGKGTVVAIQVPEV